MKKVSESDLVTLSTLIEFDDANCEGETWLLINLSSFIIV